MEMCGEKKGFSGRGPHFSYDEKIKAEEEMKGKGDVIRGEVVRRMGGFMRQEHPRSLL